MLNVVKEQVRVPWYATTKARKDRQILRERRTRRMLEVKESVRGKKEEFDIRRYFRLRYHEEPDGINELLANSVEEDYYLMHPEIKTIQELVDYHDLHEYDT